MSNTTGDFWKMIWEQKSAAIVMLTELEEDGKVRVLYLTVCLIEGQSMMTEEIPFPFFFVPPPPPSPNMELCTLDNSFTIGYFPV